MAKPKKDGELPEVLTLPEAAVWLRVSKQAMREAAMTGAVPGRLIGAKWRFSRDGLRKWFHGPTSDVRSCGAPGNGATHNGSPPVRPGHSETETEKQSLLAAVGSEKWTREKEAEAEAEIAGIYARRRAEGTVGDWEDAMAAK